MSIRENFGQRLKVLRQHRKMSQDDVSLSSGVDRSYLSEIENGKSSPTLDIIDRIAKALNVSLSDLVKPGVAEPERTYDGEPYQKAD
jgi:transcriptional regulator with XRE-family HTH domain